MIAGSFASWLVQGVSVDVPISDISKFFTHLQPGFSALCADCLTTLQLPGPPFNYQGPCSIYLWRAAAQPLQGLSEEDLEDALLTVFLFGFWVLLAQFCWVCDGRFGGESLKQKPVGTLKIEKEISQKKTYSKTVQKLCCFLIEFFVFFTQLGSWRCSNFLLIPASDLLLM